MFLRATVRKRDGKEHTYYSVVENKRLADGRLIQRHVLYLGEINSSQQLAWRESRTLSQEEMIELENNQMLLQNPSEVLSKLNAACSGTKRISGARSSGEGGG